MKIAEKKKIISKKPLVKKLSETQFWQQIALQQQALLHAKNRT